MRSVGFDVSRYTGVSESRLRQRTGNKGRGDNEGLAETLRRVRDVFCVGGSRGRSGSAMLVGGSGLVVEDSQGTGVVDGLAGGLAILLQNKGDSHPITFTRLDYSTCTGGPPRNELASGQPRCKRMSYQSK